MVPDKPGLSVVFNAAVESPTPYPNSESEFFAPLFDYNGFATHSMYASPPPKVGSTPQYARTFVPSTLSPNTRYFNRLISPKSSPVSKMEVINRLTVSANQGHSHNAKLSPINIEDLAGRSPKSQASPHNDFEIEENETPNRKGPFPWPKIDSKKVDWATKNWLEARKLENPLPNVRH